MRSLLMPVLGLVSGLASAQCMDEVLTAQTVSSSTFGSTLDLDGDLLAVTTDTIPALSGPGLLAGGINLFQRTPTGWTPAGIVTPSRLQFGVEQEYISVSLHDGLLAAGFRSNFQSRVVLFEQLSGVWTSVVTLAPPAATLIAPFGDAVALADGTAVVDRHVYELGAGGWTYVGELPTPGYENAGGTRWNAVNDEWIAVGDRSFANGAFLGAVNVFRRTPSGPVLFETLVPDLPTAFSPFGGTIALDGNRMAVGARQTPMQVGHVAIFEYDGATWRRTGRLDSPETGPGLTFGREVALSGDRIAVNGGSRTYLYERIGGTWTLISTKSIPGSAALDLEGDVLVLDGGTDIGGLSTHTVLVSSFRGGTSVQTCIGTPNSTGATGEIAALGSLRVQDANFVLEASSCPPGANGIFVYGGGAGTLPLGNGILCIDPASGLTRLASVLTVDPAGAARSAIDFAALGPFGSAGTPVHFQFWFREAVGAGFDWSDAIAVTFCP